MHSKECKHTYILLMYGFTYILLIYYIFINMPIFQYYSSSIIPALPKLTCANYKTVKTGLLVVRIMIVVAKQILMWWKNMKNTEIVSWQISAFSSHILLSGCIWRIMLLYHLIPMLILQIVWSHLINPVNL